MHTGSEEGSHRGGYGQMRQSQFSSGSTAHRRIATPGSLTKHGRELLSEERHCGRWCESEVNSGFAGMVMYAVGGRGEVRFGVCPVRDAMPL
jgi:hypothetical protein